VLECLTSPQFLLVASQDSGIASSRVLKEC
jgi:hypothetical protein